MNSSSVSPPQRIKREENVEAVFFFTWYFTVRALPARRHSATAAYTCTTSETISTDADHPQQALVRQHRLADGAQVLGVLVVGVVAGEGLEVAVHVQRARRR